MSALEALCARAWALHQAIQGGDHCVTLRRYVYRPTGRVLWVANIFSFEHTGESPEAAVIGLVELLEAKADEEVCTTARPARCQVTP